ncbi:MAG: hypothetical protein D6722_23795 [Bacteroidetes bacterium]|nr:MAG: hypothetical protein D6722_23795 [Bacteroidota bacterium]
MRNALLIVLLWGGLTAALRAQAPYAFTYQAVARDANEECIVDQAISLRFNILDQTATGTALYSELHSATTNGQGLFSVEIGRGQVLAGVYTQLEAIPWRQGSKFLKVEMDPAGGVNYQLVGTFELLSVPFALVADEAAFAETAGDVLSEPVGTVKLFWDAGGVLPLPAGWQVLDGSTVSDTLSPLNGIQLPNMTNRYAVGSAGNTTTNAVGNANHTINLAHSHQVDPHQHTVPAHTHTMSHTHSSGTYSTLLGWDNDGDVAVRRGSFSSYPAWPLSFNDALNTEGNLSTGNVGTGQMASNTASIDVAGDSGGASTSVTGSGGGGDTGSASPGTSTALSTSQSIQPESIGFVYIIKIR